METLQKEDNIESILYEIFQKEIGEGSRIEINEGKDSLNPILSIHGYTDFFLVDKDGNASRFLLLSDRSTLPKSCDRCLRYASNGSLRNINFKRSTESLLQFVLYQLPLDAVPILRTSMTSEEVTAAVREISGYFRENGILFFQPIDPKYLILSDGEVLFIPGRIEFFKIENRVDEIWSGRFCDPNSPSWRGN